MNKHLHSYDRQPILNDNCADPAAEALTSVVSSAIGKYVPKRFSRANKYPSWFSRELRRCLRRKFHYHHLFKKSGLHKCYAKFSECRALAKGFFKQDESMHMAVLETDMHTKPKNFWKYVSSKKKRNHNVVLIRDDSSYTCDPSKIANKFAVHFKSCFSSAAVTDGSTTCQGTLDFISFTPFDELKLRKAFLK